MFFDGAANMHGSGVGAVLISLDRKQFLVAVKLEFDCTNNMTEYEACIHGLQAAINLDVKNLEVFGGLALIIH